MILNASGCLDALIAPRVARSLDVYVAKTITPEPRTGNPQPRLAESDFGLLNSIGLQNPGLEVFCAEVLPRLEELEMPFWVSVGGASAADYARICERIGERESVAALEINLSCPNVDPAAAGAAEIVAACRAVTGKPLYAKLSPQLPDIAAVATSVIEAGASGLSLVNSLRGLVLDEWTLEPRLGKAVGGYSGAALRPVALAAVYSCYNATKGSVPIVGMGGVQNGKQALDLIAAGASAVALGSVLFGDLEAPERVRAELEEEAHARGFERPSEARGAAHQPSAA
ncbi:MAG: beta/alpha barrel domain-containing protein [Gaiellaceae bacterium]